MNMKSQGILKDLIDKNILKLVKKECLYFLSQNPQISNYSPLISENFEYVNSIINERILLIISNLLKVKNPLLCATEIHIQRSDCLAIPPHQDNFYHCIDKRKGLKILVPLQDLNIDNGGLIFCDNDVDQPLINHSPSQIKNFSAFIEENTFKKIKKNVISFDLKFGDCSYHFMNSIHYSLGNKTPNDTLFLVFRFQWPDLEINKKAEENYKICYKKHLEKLT